MSSVTEAITVALGKQGGILFEASDSQFGPPPRCSWAN